MTKNAPLALLLALVAAALLVRDADAAEAPADAGQGGAPDDTGTSAGTWFADLTDWLPDSLKEAAGMTNEANRAAFLAMIRRSETGTTGDRAYTTLYGGGQFTSFSDHPRRVIKAGRYTSSAAGAYQILAGTWDDLRRSGVQLPDFSPANQDRAAIALIKRRGALGYVDRGEFSAAIYACRLEWASLAGAGYGQPENSIATLASWYTAAGGTVA